MAKMTKTQTVEAAKTMARNRWIDRRMNAARPADTAFDIDQRIKARTAREAGLADRVAAFPVLDAENARDAIRFQEQRIRFHEDRLGVRRAPVIG